MVKKRKSIIPEARTLSYIIPKFPQEQQKLTICFKVEALTLEHSSLLARLIITESNGRTFEFYDQIFHSFLQRVFKRSVFNATEG